MPRGLTQRFRTVKEMMEMLLHEIDSRRKMMERLTTNVINEEDLRRCSTSWTQRRHYRDLKSRMEGSESVISHWLGLPVEPPDPYKGGKVQNAHSFRVSLTSQVLFLFRYHSIYNLFLHLHAYIGNVDSKKH